MRMVVSAQGAFPAYTATLSHPLIHSPTASVSCFGNNIHNQWSLYCSLWHCDRLTCIMIFRKCQLHFIDWPIFVIYSSTRQWSSSSSLSTELQLWVGEMGPTTLLCPHPCRTFILLSNIDWRRKQQRRFSDNYRTNPLMFDTVVDGHLQSGRGRQPASQPAIQRINLPNYLRSTELIAAYLHIGRYYQKLCQLHFDQCFSPFALLTIKW